jgi:hypothetical protein
MSQKAVERAIGKLVTDEAFRRAFGAAPRTAALLAGLELSEDELRALRLIPPSRLAQFSACLHDRICRLADPAPLDSAVETDANGADR